MSFNWNCHFCGKSQTVTKDSHSEISDWFPAGEDSPDGRMGIWALAIACANEECKKISVKVMILEARFEKEYGQFSGLNFENSHFDKYIIPHGIVKQPPQCVPLAIREDYEEACLIRDLSPKASATLVRRCLQGMIRDFAGIAKPTLNQEIQSLRAAVEDGSADRSITMESVDAIDHVRGVGNIGAHMEKDIDLIIPVDAGEAQMLIELVEMLFDEWYVARESRRLRLMKIAAIADEKKAAKSGEMPQAS